MKNEKNVLLICGVIVGVFGIGFSKLNIDGRIPGRVCTCAIILNASIGVIHIIISVVAIIGLTVTGGR